MPSTVVQIDYTGHPHYNSRYNNNNNNNNNNIERTLIRRNEGGRGILDIALLKKRQIASINKYMRGKTSECSVIKAVVRTDEGLTPVNMNRSTGLDIEEILKTRNEVRITA